jgi:colanic acid biosynthesis glycosyl transferase WcaI
MEKVIVLGRDMSKIVARRHHSADSRVVIIPNWADVDEVVPLQRKENTFLAQLDILGKFVIQYAGNMGRTHGIENLLTSARRLQNRSDIHFLFVGDGAKKQWLEESVKAFGLGNVTILPLQPRRQLCDLLNACDVAVISFIPGMAGLSVPSRMYTIMAAGKPIIAVADEDSELALVVREEAIGWVVPPDRPELLIEVIQRSQSEPEVAQEMGKRARRVAEQKYSFKRVLETYQNLFATQ